MKMWKEYWDAANADSTFTPQPPPTFLVKVQGNPGTGKSFVIHTTCNITQQVMKTMGHDKATAPTGCATSLIDGEMDAWAFPCPPVRRTLKKAPSKYSPSSVLAFTAFHKQWMQWHCHLCMDKDSMDGQPTFAWKQHWAFEGQQLPIVVDTVEADVQDNELFPVQVTSWCWGGIPIVYSIGDCHQLLPIGMKPIWDLSNPSSPNSADAIGGWLTFHDFLSPPPDSGCIGVSVIMDEVIQQSEPAYQQAIQALCDGNVSFNIATYFMNRHLSQLSPVEQSLFQEKALYIMPTWKATVPITVE